MDSSNPSTDTSQILKLPKSYIYAFSCLVNPSILVFLRQLSTKISNDYEVTYLFDSILIRHSVHTSHYDESHSLDYEHPFRELIEDLLLSVTPVMLPTVGLTIQTEWFLLSVIDARNFCFAFHSEPTLQHQYEMNIMQFFHFLYTLSIHIGVSPPSEPSSHSLDSEDIIMLFKTLTTLLSTLTMTKPSPPRVIQTQSSPNLQTIAPPASSELIARLLSAETICLLPSLVSGSTRGYLTLPIKTVCTTMTIHGTTTSNSTLSGITIRETYFTAKYLVSTRDIPTFKTLASSSLHIPSSHIPSKWSAIPQEIDDQIKLEYVFSLFQGKCQHRSFLPRPSQHRIIKYGVLPQTFSGTSRSNDLAIFELTGLLVSALNKITTLDPGPIPDLEAHRSTTVQVISPAHAISEPTVPRNRTPSYSTDGEHPSNLRHEFQNYVHYQLQHSNIKFECTPPHCTALASGTTAHLMLS